jgi:sec-independent protein translocase protein TatA
METMAGNILLFGISGGEIIVILFVILLVFGPKKIPEIARLLGRGLKEIKKVQSEINVEINKYSDDSNSKVSEDIQRDIDEFKKQRKHTENEQLEESEEIENTNDNTDDSDLPYPYNKSGKINTD